jgi:hypothetical protein
MAYFGNWGRVRGKNSRCPECSRVLGLWKGWWWRDERTRGGLSATGMLRQHCIFRAGGNLTGWRCTVKRAPLLQICMVAASLALLPQVSAQEWANVFVPQGCAARAADATEDYRSWIKPYTKSSRKGGLDGDQVQVSITVLDGDNLAPVPSAGRRFCGDYCCQMNTTYSLSSDGMASSTQITPMAVQGAGPGRLPAGELQTVQKLTRDLLEHPPDDHAILPPPGRRLVLQVEARHKAIARVYDRADIPSPVMEALGLIGATSGPIWMDFKPSVRKGAESGESPIAVTVVGIRVFHDRDPATKALRAPTATLALSPDGSMMATHYFYLGPRTVVTDRSGTSIFLAISDYEVDRRGIYVSRAFFSPDSRYLLLLSNLPAIYIYDTRTWKALTSLPGLPTGATAFYPSSDWKHGVAVLRNGAVEAWDVSKGQKQTDLDLQGELQDVSFSEDDSLFAVSSIHDNGDSSSSFHLRVWDTKSGQFLREMIPPYYFEQDVMSRPMWWDHGKYLLANVRAGHWGGYMIAVWNVQSGQLRGGFSACDSSQDPFEVGVDGPRLLKWCFDGTLLVWDVPAAIERVAAFEQSLNR